MRARETGFSYKTAKYFFGVAKRRDPRSQFHMRHLILPLIFVAALTAQAQTFSFGAKAGVPVTSALPYDNSPYSIVDTGRWTVGPTAEVPLFSHLSFEADALFRAYRFQTTGASFLSSGFTMIANQAGASGYSRQDTKEWDFPLLLKYRFHAG